LLLGVVTLAIIFVIVGRTSFLSQARITATTSGEAAEIQHILATRDLAEQVQWYQELIERVGAVVGQEELLYSGLPFDGQTHLLNHTVGEYLYEHSGFAGLVQCKDYFLASCYHGFLIKAIGENGVSSVERVVEECKKVHRTVVSQCVHSVGHGFLAWVGYTNLPKALSLCDQILGQDRELSLFNCYDGVFMENIWAVHENGQPSPERWVDLNDPVYPCNDPRIDTKYLHGCWSNQPSLLYQRFQGDVERVGEECLNIEDSTHQRTCFNGLARQIHPITAGSVDTTFELCEKMPTDWIDYCVLTVAGSAFGVGDREVPFQICGRIEAVETKKECFSTLSGHIGAYAKNTQEQQEWCRKILDNSIRENCIAQP